MEAASEKLSPLIHVERKLKQATLPFERLSSSPKIPKLDDTPKPNKINDDIQVVTIIQKKKIPAESHVEPVKNTQQTVSEVVIEDELSNSAEEMNHKPHVCDTSDTTLVDVSDHLKIEDSLNCSKRKLNTEDKTKEQKPHKRAKLIYHVDKLKKNDVCVTVAENDVKNIDGQLNASSSGEFNESDVKNKCFVNGSNEVKNIEDENGEIIDLASSSDMSVDECPSSDVKQGGSDTVSERSQKKLTPKQLLRRAEFQKKREMLQMEKERKRKERDRIKQEKEEEKNRLKQEKEEVKKKLKEEREKKKQVEIELKNEEKRKKEEEKRRKEEQKLEDKRKKEEQKLEDKRKKEELQRKKEEEEELLKKKITKEAEAFSSFFKKCDVKAPVVKEEEKLSNEVVFMPFTVKADMRLAPVNRNPMDEERRLKFEKSYNEQAIVDTYLTEFRSGIVVPKKSGNTWPLDEKYDEIVVLDEDLDLKDEVVKMPQRKFNNPRPKLLQFHENRRPPYWGTWRKKSKFIKAKNPFGKDEIFDYEIDSDDEWEEEEPGESLHGSDDEKESEDEYEVDNDFFVPHGYLSEDENPEDELISPEAQKAKLKLLGEQFDMERNEKTKFLKPIVLGCVWFKNELDEPDSVNPSVVKFLSKRKAVPWTDNIQAVLAQDEITDPSEVCVSDGGTPSSAKKAAFPETAVRELITLIHGSTNSRKSLASVFLSQWMKTEDDKKGDSDVGGVVLSRARVAKKIKELGNWGDFPEEGPFYGKKCWYVQKELREKYGVADVLVKEEDVDNVKKLSPPLITKFTKVLTEDERRNQMAKSSRKSLIPNQQFETPEMKKKPQKIINSANKLKEFFAKPSLNSKYSFGMSVSTDNAEIEIVEERITKSEVALTAKPEGNKSFEKMEEDASEQPAANEVQSSTPNGTSQTADHSTSPKPVVKKRVPILFSVPRGCNIIKRDLVSNEGNVTANDCEKSKADEKCAAE